VKGSLDMLDRQIIRLLQQDGRMSGSEIARQLNVPVRTVRYRVDQMVERKDIFPTVIVNRQNFGYRMAVDIFCQVEINKMEEIAEILKDFDQINYIAYSFGDQDISIQALLEDADKAFDFVQKLANIPEVQRTKTVLVPRIVKNTYEWIPPETDFLEFPEEMEQGIEETQ
jgi:Lrp/AsnC family transcriptional regulator for asnA, asnC and gidA